MPNSVLISLDVFVIGFIISFFIAIIIKVLMSCIRFFVNRSEKKSGYIKDIKDSNGI